ncbi:MAG: T9SS type A sorting domain-containing protein [Chitinispirillaceae bacterium]|nr:T9SS type A sorting domain-containing protein [Chitinispirillaceae bacterium]
MGKQIMRATRWSCRSLFAVYSRFMTLLFALFCAAAGLLPKSASAKSSTSSSTVFKGTAYRAADSTVLSNIRLFLQDCFQPDYGIYPEYGVEMPVYGIAFTGDITADSIMTDENGNFTAELPAAGELFQSIQSEVVNEADSMVRYYSSACIAIEKETDSSYTLYLRQSTIPTAVERRAARSAEPAVMSTLRGEQLQIRIPEWNGQKTVASIVNSRGQETATLTAGVDGIIHWDTRAIAKGIYFLRAKTGQNNLRVKILVK